MAKVLLNAFYLQSQGKLQNGPGYIRAGIEDGYDLLPQVASRLEGRRRELQAQLREIEDQTRQSRETDARESQEAAVAYVLERLHPDDLQATYRRRPGRPSRAHREAQPDPLQPLRPGQGLRAGLRRSGRVSQVPSSADFTAIDATQLRGEASLGSSPPHSTLRPISERLASAALGVGSFKTLSPMWQVSIWQVVIAFSGWRPGDGVAALGCDAARL